MKSSLKTIQVLAKIGCVLSKVVWICCIVGAVGCLVGIASLAIGVDEVLKIGDVTIYGIIKNEAGRTVGSMYATMITGMIFCIGELVLALFAERYFKNELKAGNPFTFAGANEMKRLGILAICIPVGTTVVAELANLILDAVFLFVGSVHISDYTSIGLGIAFLIMSVIFHYGAEQNADNADNENTNASTEKAL